MSNRASETVAARIRLKVLVAAQEAEELGGPELEEYAGLMESLASEFASRAEVARERLKADVVLTWWREQFPDCDVEVMETGGGCDGISITNTAARLAHKPGDPCTAYWLVTEAGGACVPESLNCALALGYYTDIGTDREFWMCWDCSSKEVAVTIIRSMVSTA